MATYSASIEHTLNGQAVVNVIGMQSPDSLGAETTADAAVIAEQVAISWKQRFLPTMVPQARFLRVVVRGMINPQVSGVSIAAAANGSNNVAGLPSFVAASIVFGTNTPGRAGRGRTGIGGIGEAGTLSDNGNMLDAGTQTALQTAINGLFTDLAAAVPTIQPVVISRFQGTDSNGNPLPRVGGPIASVIVTKAVQSKVGSRVSRLR